MKQKKITSFFGENEQEFNTITLPSFNVVGMEMIFKKENNRNFQNFRESRELWQNFNQNLYKIPNRVQKKKWEKFGIKYHVFDNNYEQGITTKYLACVEVLDIKLVNQSMVGLIIPEMTWKIHTHTGILNELPNTLDKISSRISTKSKNNESTHIQFLSSENPVFKKIEFIDHIERYDKRFHWSKTSSEIDLFFPYEKKY